MSEEEIVQFVGKKTVKELDIILKSRGLTTKGNKKDKQARVVKALVDESKNTEIQAEGKVEEHTNYDVNTLKHEKSEIDKPVTDVDEKLNEMEQRMRHEMKTQFQDIHNMLALLLKNGQDKQGVDGQENQGTSMNEVPKKGNSPADGVNLSRASSCSSLSNKGTRELKKKFEIIVREIEIELNGIVDAMKEESESVSAVKVGIECLKSKEDRCGKLIDKYAGLDDEEEELNSMIEHWLELQDKCRKVKTRAQDFQNKMRKKDDDLKRIRENVRLPKMQVKEFRGDPLEWPNWYASFKRCVHDNKDLNESAKHDYLMSLVKGKAEQAIKGYFDDPNKYEQALQVLEKRFGNNRLVSKAYLTYFLDTKEPEENAEEMRKHYDRQLNATGTLKMYKVDDDNLKLAVCEKTLPSNVKREWEKKHEEILKSKKSVKLEDYFEFYDGEITSWEATKKIGVESDGNKIRRDNRKRRYQNYKRDGHKPFEEPGASSIQSLIAQGKASQPCIFCDSKSHLSAQCKTVLSKDVDERWKLVSAAKCCFNCLLPMTSGHNSQSCSAAPCGESGCQLKHSKILHSTRKPKDPGQNKEISAEHIVPVRIAATKSDTTDKQKLCPMAIGTLIYEQKEVPVRVFLDTGSCESYVCENIAESLKMEKIHPTESITTTGFGGTGVKMKTKRVRFSLSRRNRTKNDEAVEIEAWTTKKICDPVEPVDVDLSKYPQLRDLELADGYPRGPSTVDVLVGVDYANLFQKDEKLKINERLTAQKSVFGWIIQGVIPNERLARKRETRLTTMLAGTPKPDQEIREGLSILWSIEQIGIDGEKVLTPEENSAVKQFQETLKFDETERCYEVGLPWKSDPPPLIDNYDDALKRLQSVERSLARNPEKKRMYCEAMEKYFAEGHARVIEENETADKVRYLPHHAVYRMDKSTSKCRIVFDGSAKTKDGVCLNDCLLEGPNVLPDLVHVVTRFRCKREALSGDIQSMFLQIKLSPDEQHVHRFLWRNMETDKPPAICCMTRVTFGVKSSPFVSESTIRAHVDRYDDEFPVAAAEVKDNMYVDDLDTGADSVDDAILLRQDITKLLKNGGFHIRKWASNSVEVMATIPEEDCAPEMNAEFNKKDQGTLKTLGIAWDTKTDCLFYNATSTAQVKPETETKKTMLSKLASTFDPIGNYSPVTIRGKCMIKEAWIRGLKWDDPLPDALAEEFEQWRLELENLHLIKIQRCFMEGMNTIVDVQLHGFSDSSEKAYGGAVYIRLEDEDGRIRSNLVMSKSRLAPIKKKTLPRLELCGALILARLMNYIIKALRIEVSQVFCWTDSMIVLSWIRRPAGTWKTFVANRVQEIQERTDPQQWSHVIGKENPADLLTRGMKVEELKKSQLWWHGPTWLQQPRESWPLSDIMEETDCLQEMKRTVMVSTTKKASELIPDWCSRIERWMRLLRVTARILSWRRLSVDRHQPRELNCEDLMKAEIALLRCIQMKHYDKELRLLNEGKPVARESKILKLDPQLNEDGVLRVGGRLQQAQIPEDSKHQIILPHGEDLVAKIIMDTHMKHAHAGPETTLAILRERYWITQGRRETKRILKNCPICKHQGTTSCKQKMGDLPAERVKTWIHAGFTDVGLDFLGPIIIKEGKQTRKVWICLFVDANSRAVHLEVCLNMTTEEFLDAYRRMSNRRGISETITSDNQTSFHKADKVLTAAYRRAQAIWKKLDKKEIERRFVSMGIKWKFNTERASHQGGQWEKFCDKVKRPLKLVVGKALLTYQELQTVLTDIEAQINSRPITYIGDDISDGMVITPAHLVLGRPLGRLPDFPNRFEREINLKKRFLYRQRIADHFWKRFQKEYLPTLNVRHKWNIEEAPLASGDVVLVAEDNLPRCKWTIAKVEQLYVGRDGLVRNVKVKTPRGYLNRPIQKLHLLEKMSTMDSTQKSNEELCEQEKIADKDETSSALPREDVQNEIQARTRTTRSGRVVTKPKRYRAENETK